MLSGRMTADGGGNIQTIAEPAGGVLNLISWTTKNASTAVCYQRQEHFTKQDENHSFVLL